jgi:magnesium transporter
LTQITFPSYRRKKRSVKAGLPPGTIVHIGNESNKVASVNYFKFSADTYEEVCGLTTSDLHIPLSDDSVTWVEVEGIHQTEIIEKIGAQFSLHPLVMEDIANATQRPKVEETENQIFVVLKMVQFDQKHHRITIEQVSLVIGKNYVLMFQENNADVFDKVRERIRQTKGKLRKSSADYLAYTLIDTIVDNYFVVLELMGEELEDIEHELVNEPNRSTLNRIYKAKRSMMNLRRAGWPLREVAGSLERNDSDLINKSTKIYLRDLYDHSVEIIDVIENLRDISSGMIDVYLSSMSHKLNEVMKVLTIIATIFMPLTFISSIYGMNFEFMPELKWQYGYPAILTVMATITIGMLMYFRRRSWI